MSIPTTTARFILYFAKKHTIKLSLLILAFIIWTATDAFFPYFLKHIVNIVQNFHGERSGIYSAVSWWLFLLIGSWFIAELCMRAQGILQIYTFPKLRAEIREAVFDYVSKHSHDYFASEFSGNVAKKLADLSQSCQNVMEIVCLQFTAAGTGAIFVIGLMWLTSPFFALILLAWLVIHFLIIYLFLRYGNQLSEVHSDTVSTLSGKIVDVLSNMLNVRLFARTRYEADHLKSYQADEMIKAKKAMYAAEWMRIGLGVNGLFLVFGMVFLLLYGWTQHWVTIGDFTQILMQSFWLLGWMWFLSFQMTQFARETGTIASALSIIQKAHDLVDIPGAKPITVAQGAIQFKEVVFGYQANSPVFNHLNVSISAGEKVGLVGFSGSGKSTFVNLILRFFDIQRGAIIIDNQIIADVQQESLRAQIAMIPQEPALFHRSLMDNIRYGRITASDEDVINASKLAHCHEFIEKLPLKYAALVGERGVKLSGGQRQRIAIARAILKNAPILILDEATSALDSVTERLIQDSLHQLMENRTAIVIAHRLSTLADMDRILVFHHGEIIEEGTKESLLALNGHFTKLWNMQTDGFIPEDTEIES